MGITMDKRLTWKQNIDSVRATIKKIMDKLYPHVDRHSHTELKIEVNFISGIIARTQLTYGSAACGHTAQKVDKKIKMRVLISATCE